jgi:cyanophycinase-like exopeptidase
VCILYTQFTQAQLYTSYFIGDTADVETNPVPGVCLMGGAGEHDNAMRWFLTNADGGDILVLRTDDSDGYNDYLYNDLGIDVNSVETIVCNSPSASAESYIITQIEHAEAIWFAGGDQWDYLSYWRDTEVEDALNYCINTKGITIGGISAGMAIQGEYYFSAENGTVTSTQAMNNPYGVLVQLGFGDFLENPLTENIITDTHFDNPDRRGRLATFLARILLDTDSMPYAIACNEYTSVCIDENKIAHVFGDYPDYDDIVYFVQVNCEEPFVPEICEDDTELHWVRGNAALKVVSMFATNDGDGTFDLNDWKTVHPSGPWTWENWWIENGEFFFAQDVLPIAECSDSTVNIHDESIQPIVCYPNPAEQYVFLQLPVDASIKSIGLYNLQGKTIDTWEYNGTSPMHLPVSGLTSGIYMLAIQMEDKTLSAYFVKQ